MDNSEKIVKLLEAILSELERIQAVTEDVQLHGVKRRSGLDS